MTHRDWARHFGKRQSTLSLRLQRGVPAEQIFAEWEAEYVKRGAYRPKLVTHNGETKSHRAWAKQFGIPSGTLSSRFEAGWTFEEATRK